MRRLFLALGVLLGVAALTLTIVIATSRPFTAYGTGAQPLAKPLRAAAALDRQLLNQLQQIPGAKLQRSKAVGYNQGDQLRGLSLCRSRQEGLYSFSASLQLPGSLTKAEAGRQLDAAFAVFARQPHGALKVQVSSPKNPLGSRLIRFSGASNGSILTSFNDGTLSLAGSADGCYPLAQLPATPVDTLEGQ